jgi:ribosome maturation factor RimP
MDLKEEITKLVEEKIAGSDNFLVEVKVTPGKVLVTLDHPQGIMIEECVKVNRMLQAHFENTPVFEKRELEVGSPGMEEPLLVLKQFHKRIGREVSVLTLDGVKHTGTLMSADGNELSLNEDIVVKTGNKKEKHKQLNNIPFNTIKETRVIFSFDKII